MELSLVGNLTTGREPNGKKLDDRVTS